MTYLGSDISKRLMEEGFQPRLVEKSTGHLYILVRDDTSTTGKIYVAPVGMMTSMQSVKPEAFNDRFEPYIDPRNRPIPVEAVQEVITNIVNQNPAPDEGVPEPEMSKKRGGRPKGRKDTKKRKSPRKPKAQPKTEDASSLD